MVRIRNAALWHVFRPAVTRMSIPQSLNAGSSTESTCKVQHDQCKDETMGTAGNQQHVLDRVSQDEYLLESERGSIRHKADKTVPFETGDISRTTSRTRPAASSSSDFFQFSLYSHLLQGRQHGQPFWAGAPCYVRGAPNSPVKSHSRSSLQTTCTPALLSNSGTPAVSTMTYSSHSTQPVLSNSGTPAVSTMTYSSHSTQPVLKKAKPEYEIDNTEDINVAAEYRGREDPSLIGTRGIPREWEYTSFGRAHRRQPQSGVELTVLSYNVLSQQLLEDNSFLYPHCTEDVLMWESRKNRLLQEMIAYQPDVLCLQEVQDDHYRDFFLPQLSAANYEGVFQKRTGNKPDGCAIFVKRGKLTIHKSFPILYNRGDILDRDNIALIVQLKSSDKSGKRQSEVFIATTHLLFNPKRGDIKLAQLSILLAELDRLTNRGSSPGNFTSYAPIILCGDFNTEPQSDIYKFLLRGYLRYEGLLSRTLSGQRERHYGRDAYLSNQLLHPKLGITDQCQYVRYLHQRNVPVPDYVCEATGIGKDGPVKPRETTPDTSSPSTSDPICPPWGVRFPFRPGHSHVPKVSQGLGCLWHNLNFVSAYNHTIERLGHGWNEVTTQHEHASCTLDYIFYNVLRKRTHTQRNRVRLQNVEDDKLHLIGRYGLLSCQEIAELGGLPSKHLASDHLALVAKFLLKYS